MGRRSALVVAVLAVLAAGAGFAVGSAVFDDDGPDTPPRTRTGDEAGADPDATTTSTTAPAPTLRTEALTSPAWIAVIASEGDEAGATAIAHGVLEDGSPAGLLRSDDYPSMRAGFWVAYAGPYPDADSASAAVAALREGGWPAAYARCAGTVEDCGAPPAPEAEGNGNQGNGNEGNGNQGNGNGRGEGDDDGDDD